MYLDENGLVWDYGYISIYRLGQYRGGELISPDELCQFVSNGVEDLYLGAGTVLVLKKDRSLWGVGVSYDGQLGSSRNHAGDFVELSAGPVPKAAIGEKQNAWFLEDGSLWGIGDWEGSSWYGRRPRSFPARGRPSLLGEVKGFGLDGSQILALREDGKLYGAGYGSYYVLLSRNEQTGTYWKALIDMRPRSEALCLLPPILGLIWKYM